MGDSGSAYLGGAPVSWETFLDTPPEESDFDASRVVVLPVPYDSTTSYRGGSRYGPRAIIAASKHLEDYDIELDRDISLVGIHTAPNLSPDVSAPEAMIARVRGAVDFIARNGKLPVLLGGEHTVTVGAVQAMRGHFEDLSVLYLDAHCDLRDTYMGSRWSHACVARRLHKLCTVVHVGVRSMAAEEKAFIDATGARVTLWEPGQALSDSLTERILAGLSDRVYVSIDLDVFDPSIMAAVGTPEPGGMLWADVLGLLRAVSERRQIVGFDIVELSPPEGPEACAFTAAKLAYKLMGYATSA